MACDPACVTMQKPEHQSSGTVVLMTDYCRRIVVGWGRGASQGSARMVTSKSRPKHRDLDPDVSTQVHTP